MSDATFISIDQNALDKEWLRQPELMYDYSVQLADARSAMDLAKNKAEVVYAQLDADIRANPTQYGINKISETAIKNAIASEKAYRISQRKVLETRHELDILQAAVTALDHKKQALQNLVTLHGQSYFSSPSAGATGKAALEDITKQSVRRGVKH
jgi:uncharacterized protein YpiB (UPF0302 family)